MDLSIIRHIKSKIIRIISRTSTTEFFFKKTLLMITGFFKNQKFCSILIWFLYNCSELSAPHYLFSIGDVRLLWEQNIGLLGWGDQLFVSLLQRQFQGSIQIVPTKLILWAYSLKMGKNCTSVIVRLLKSLLSIAAPFIDFKFLKKPYLRLFPVFCRCITCQM